MPLGSGIDDDAPGREMDDIPLMRRADAHQMERRDRRARDERLQIQRHGILQAEGPWDGGPRKGQRKRQEFEELSAGAMPERAAVRRVTEAIIPQLTIRQCGSICRTSSANRKSVHARARTAPRRKPGAPCGEGAEGARCKDPGIAPIRRQAKRRAIHGTH